MKKPSVTISSVSKLEKSKRLSAPHYTVSRKELVEDKTRKDKPYNKDATQKKGNDLTRLKAIIEGNQESVNDIDGIMQLIPELQLIKEILVSSILSPKDLTSIKLDIQVDRRAPPEMAEILRKHFTSEYNLEAKLPDIIADSLFLYGSRTLVPIPATTISKFIEGNYTALESTGGSVAGLYNTGHLIHAGPITQSGFGLESMGYSLKAGADQKVNPIELKGKISITDNPIALLQPSIKEVINKNKREEGMKAIYPGLESIGSKGGEFSQIASPYIKKLYDRVASTTLKTDKDHDPLKEVIDPLVFSWNHGIVIPVIRPGERENRVGVYIAIDKDGYGLKSLDTKNYFKELAERLRQTTKGNDYQMIQTTQSGVVSTSVDVDSEDFLKPLFDTYIDSLEKELAEGVEKGAHGDRVEIRCPDGLYRTMLARQLSNMDTQLLFIPEEMVTYWAYDFDENGKGLSLLEKSKLWASFRATTLFATIMGSIKNSVGRRELHITLDEDDPNHRETKETILNEFVALQTSTLPLGKLSPSDIIDSLQRAGIQITIDGGEYFPGTKIALEETHRDFHTPDTEVNDMIAKMLYNGLSVTPDQVDRSQDGELAAGIYAGNLIQTKRILIWQSDTIEMGSGFIQRYVRCGGPLYATLKKKLEEVKGVVGEMTLDDFIDSIRLRLPTPDMAIIKAQKEEFDAYSEFVDEAIKFHSDSTLFGELFKGPEMKEVVENQVANIKAQIMREYMRQNNVLPELDRAFSHSEDDISDDIIGHQDKVMRTIMTLMLSLRAKEAKYEKIIEKNMDKIFPNGEPDGMGGGDSGGDDFGGGDDVGGDDDDDPFSLDIGGDDAEMTVEGDDAPAEEEEGEEQHQEEPTE